MSGDRWCSERTLQFVHEYRKHPCLWDTSDQQYKKNRVARDGALRAIAAAMDIDGFDEQAVRKKIRIIRSTYWNERSKIQNSAFNGGPLYQPKTPWYNVAHQFLASVSNMGEHKRKKENFQDLLRKHVRPCKDPSGSPKHLERPEGHDESSPSVNSFLHFLTSMGSPYATPKLNRVSDGEGGSGDGLPAGPSMAESSPNFLTCAPLLASMSGLQHGSRLSGTDDDDSRHHPDVKPDVPLLIDDVDEGESHLNNQASGEESSMPSPPSQGLSGPYLLKKETHCTTILDQLLKDQDYADVTLTAEGRSIFAHKMVLCLASSYFRQVLAKDSNVRSVIVFRDIKFAELKNIINFVYTGEATVDAADLESFMKTAESLEISSLCENEKTVPQQLRSSPSKEPARSSAPETDKPTRIAAKSPMRLSVGLPPQKRKLNNQSPSKRSKHQARFQPVSPTPGPDLSLVKPEPDGVFECEEPEIGCSPPASPRRTQDPPLALTGPDKAPPGRCPFCTASSEFYEGTAIQNHLRTNHPDKTAFPCVACARVFLKKGLFEVHKADCVR